MTDQSDRELLEAAARAVGIEYEWRPSYGNQLRLTAPDAQAIYWRPLDDDGDAFRLAVKLLLAIEHSDPRGQDSWVCAIPLDKMTGPMEEVDGESYRAGATRRAIVRAAAALAKEKRNG